MAASITGLIPRQSLLMNQGPVWELVTAKIQKSCRWRIRKKKSETDKHKETKVLTGSSKELSEEILPCVIAEEVCVLCEQHRREGPAHLDALLVGRLVLELILIIPVP